MSFYLSTEQAWLAALITAARNARDDLESHALDFEDADYDGKLAPFFAVVNAADNAVTAFARANWRALPRKRFKLDICTYAPVRCVRPGTREIHDLHPQGEPWPCVVTHGGASLTRHHLALEIPGLAKHMGERHA